MFCHRIGLVILLKIVFFLTTKIIYVTKKHVIMFKFVCLLCFLYYSDRTLYRISIADSPLYLSKSIRIRQIRVERKDCHPRINNLFYPLIPPSCFVVGKDLMNDKLFVVGGQRKCSSWNESLSYRFCKDVCNYTSIWSALAYRKITKLYTTYESPWYFMLHLLPKETVC